MDEADWAEAGDAEGREVEGAGGDTVRCRGCAPVCARLRRPVPSTPRQTLRAKKERGNVCRNTTTIAGIVHVRASTSASHHPRERETTCGDGGWVWLRDDAVCCAVLLAARGCCLRCGGWCSAIHTTARYACITMSRVRETAESHPPCKTHEHVGALCAAHGGPLPRRYAEQRTLFM